MKTRLIYGATTNRVEEGKTGGRGIAEFLAGWNFARNWRSARKKSIPRVRISAA